MKSSQGSGDVYVEVKSYEHGKEEDHFGSFAFDDSPKKGTDTHNRPTKMLNKTMPEPFDRDVYFNEEQNMGVFVKGETHEISFVVKQKTQSGDAAIGEVSIKSDDYLDPFRPAREVYLLFYDPPRFQSSLYLNVLFVPSSHTLDKMRIAKPVPEDFDSAYHEWILSKSVYVDEYKFIVPIGKYHPRLVDSQEIRVDEQDFEDYEERKEEQKYGVTPEKRLRNAIDSVPSLRDYNHQLQEQNTLRPEYEEILYHFRQMQMYLNNEAKAKANQMRQEYCWNDFLMKVTEQIHDNSVDPSGDVDEFGGNLDPKARGHMFSVAGRSTWGKESWQNVDIQTLCRLGISPNLRNRVWYDLLEVSRIEEMTQPNLVELPEYSRGLNTYENLKLIAVKYTNIAFAQIDEDMNTLNISNTPTVDDRGKIKNILKCFVLWQKICETHLCYSINFWFIIQRLLSFYSEERAFWIFVAIMDKMKNRIGIEHSLMLDRKGMFRLFSACLSSHCKQMMPEIFSKFTEIGVSIDFFLYDQMSSLFSN